MSSTTMHQPLRLRAAATIVLIVATTLALTAPAESVTVPATYVVTSPAGASTSPDTAFAPNTLVMLPGGSLTYVNADLVVHNLSSAEPGLFKSPTVTSGGQADVAGVSELEPGVYDYLCTLHPTMTGSLTVLGDGGTIPVPLPEPELPPSGGTDEVDEDVVYETLVASTNEPMALDVAEDGRVVWTERDGTFSVLVPGVPVPVTSQIPVAGNLCEACTLADPLYTFERLQNNPGNIADNPQSFSGPNEAGLYGVLLDDDFAETNRVFLFYAEPGSSEEVAPGVFWGRFNLSTFTLDPATNLLDLGSEEVVLTVPIEWQNPAHLGGDLDYLPDGTIVVTTGDNVLPTASEGYGARDATTHYLNAELTSANPADRRGKVLRLREDGSVPDGSVAGEVPNPFIGMEGWNPYIEDSATNPFVGDFAGVEGDGWIGFDPYVYSMGYKQAWRAVVMPNGDMYVSDIGPDAGSDDPQKGPRGFEEISHIPFGGGTHAGWPRCQGPNWSYTDYDWSTLEANGPLDCSEDAVIARRVVVEDGEERVELVTGMTGATFYYPSGPCDGSDANATYQCDRWPIVGSGAKTSEPVVFYDDSIDGPYVLPDRFRNNVFVLEWSRSFILTIPADPLTSELQLDNDAMALVNPPQLNITPETDAPQAAVSARADGRYLSPIDAHVGPDGAIYLLEYGATFYVGEVGRLSRLRGTGAAVTATGTSASGDVSAGTADGAHGAGGGATGADGVPPDTSPAAGVVDAAGSVAASDLAATPARRGLSGSVLALVALAAVMLLADQRRRRLVP